MTPATTNESLDTSLRQAPTYSTRERLYAMMVNRLDSNFIGVFNPGCCTGDSPTLSLGIWQGNAPLIEGPVLDGAGNIYTIPYRQDILALDIFSAPLSDSTNQPTRQATLSGLTWGFRDMGNGIAVSNNGTLFVADYDRNEILIYTPPYTNAATVLSKGIDQPIWVGVNKYDVLFVANAGNTSITVYNPPSSPTANPTSTITSIPFSITSIFALSGNGTLFIADSKANEVKAYKFPYTTTAATITNGVSGAIGMTSDALENLFVLNSVSSFTSQSVMEYAPPYTGTPTTAFKLTWQKGPCCDSGIWMQGAITVR